MLDQAALLIGGHQQLDIRRRIGLQGVGGLPHAGDAVVPVADDKHRAYMPVTDRARQARRIGSRVEGSHDQLPHALLHAHRRNRALRLGGRCYVRLRSGRPP